jgi:phosphatidylglycerophosphate synthase
VLGAACCVLAGAGLWLTAHTEGWAERGLWAGAGALAAARLACNMLDGMVAIERGVASAVGELYNEVPDRISDMAVLAGLGMAAGSSAALGLVAACLAVMTAYVRAAARAAGAPQDFRGPMAKPQRMWVVIGVCVAMSVLPGAWRGAEVGSSTVGLPAAGLGVIVVGCVVTCWRRLARAGAALREARA